MSTCYSYNMDGIIINSDVFKFVPLVKKQNEERNKMKRIIFKCVEYE